MIKRLKREYRYETTLLSLEDFWRLNHGVICCDDDQFYLANITCRNLGFIKGNSENKFRVQYITAHFAL